MHQRTRSKRSVYTFGEMINMFSMYVNNSKDANEARRAYQEAYPNRKIPSAAFIVFIDENLKKYGRVRVDSEDDILFKEWKLRRGYDEK